MAQLVPPFGAVHAPADPAGQVRVVIPDHLLRASGPCGVFMVGEPETRLYAVSPVTCGAERARGCRLGCRHVTVMPVVCTLLDRPGLIVEARPAERAEWRCRANRLSCECSSPGGTGRSSRLSKHSSRGQPGN